MPSATYVVFIRHLPSFDRQQLTSDNGSPRTFSTREAAELAARACAQRIADAHAPDGRLLAGEDGFYLVESHDGVLCAQVFVVGRQRVYRTRSPVHDSGPGAAV